MHKKQGKEDSDPIPHLISFYMVNWVIKTAIIPPSTTIIKFNFMKANITDVIPPITAASMLFTAFKMPGKIRLARTTLVHYPITAES